jgi:hypothetical protein
MTRRADVARTGAALRLAAIATLLGGVPAAAAAHHPKPFYVAPALQLQAGPCQLTQFADKVRCDFTIVVGNTGTLPTEYPVTIRDTVLTAGGTVVKLGGSGCNGQSGAGAMCTMTALQPGQSWVIDAYFVAPTSQVKLDHCLLHDQARLTEQGFAGLTSNATGSAPLGQICKLPQPNPAGGATYARPVRPFALRGRPFGAILLPRGVLR